MILFSSPEAFAVASHTRSLIESVAVSNFDSSHRELCLFAESDGDTRVMLIQACLDEIKSNAKEITNGNIRKELLASLFRYMLEKKSFSANFCESLKSLPMADNVLEDLSSLFKLSAAERIGLGLSLFDSEDLDFRVKGKNFCIAQLEELHRNPSVALLNDQIQDIEFFLYQNASLSKHMDSFTKILSQIEVGEQTYSVPTPILSTNMNAARSTRNLVLDFWNYDDDFEANVSQMSKEVSVPDVLNELGHGCTISNAHCIEIFSLFHPLNDCTIANIVGTVVRSNGGIGDNSYSTFLATIGSSLASDSSEISTWNVDVLVDSIKHLAPKTNWICVMENLDHEGFIIPDERAFYLLMSIYNCACQDLFPLHAFCGSVWKNTEGQLSFLRYAVSAPPTIFSFEHSSRRLSFPGVFHLTDDNHAWMCMDLLDILCHIAEEGHADSVWSMLQYPLAHCPEILLLGIAKINTAYNLLQSEVACSVFITILKDPAKSNVISYLWEVNPRLLMRGFVDGYADPICLLRIVDICDDLKILQSILDNAPFSMGIKIAAIVSQKKQMDFEKWFTENLTVYQDIFFEECLSFLKEVITEMQNSDQSNGIQPSMAVNKYFKELCPPFFKVLQSHLGHVMSNQFIEELNNLYVTFQEKNDVNMASEVLAPQENSDEIESTANSYFHKMFSEQLKIDEMVHMLARFKESGDKRELLVFNCMIGNLFEEYKFFPKYPDKQLKLAAVLFGSLIKHQLVTHLALGIALRAVLDALRKSVDSKMFMFGTNALEQFMDRLIEWPQYCNHILQISHLRSTHPELVSLIERALAKISSSQSESNGVNALPSDQSSGSAPENIEATEVSWQLVSSSQMQMDRQQSVSPLQQRQQSVLNDKLKKANINAFVGKSLSPNVLQAPASSSLELASSQKATVMQPPFSSSHYSSTATANTASSTALRPRNVGTSGMLRQPSQVTGFGTALNIETLVAAAEQRDTPIEAPPPEVQDKILFIVNNISLSNVEAKAKEFSEVMQEQHYPWFAQYMVMKRASIEPNFHDVYLKFFDAVSSKALNKEVVKATYENCKVLLRSDLIKSSSEERSLLKNLGSWLGKFTIGRNQVLRANELDPKIQIIEAYEKGLMIAVIPFTSKILEPCQSSIAYRPPNPWTMAILSLLVEIYNLPNLKMNLKFDIEVLFKNLGVDMKEVKPTSLLKDKSREIEGNPDFSHKDVTVSQPAIGAEVSSGSLHSLNHVEFQPEVTAASRAMSVANIMNQMKPPGPLSSCTVMDDDKSGTLVITEQNPQVHGISHVLPSSTPSTPSPSPSPFSLNQLLPSISSGDNQYKINPKLEQLGTYPYQRIIELAMSKAVKEIIAPVVQRSVTIASRTTKELILKDFSSETNDSSIIHSAHLMVGTLAGSLAHVTCKEPLRVALSASLRAVIQDIIGNNVKNEQIHSILANDHIDLGCAMIEDVAQQKAIEIIDGEIAQSFSQLRKQREAAGAPYFDPFAYGPYGRLPEALRPKSGHLSLAQRRVYEDFVNVWSSSTQSLNISPTPAGMNTITGSSIVPRAYSAPNSGSYSSQIVPFSGMAPPMEVTSDEMEHGTVHLSNAPSLPVGADDSAIQHGATTTLLTSFPATVVSTDPTIGETAVVPKDMVSTGLPVPATSAERLAAVSPEHMTTGDALIRYQQVVHKVEALISKEGSETEIQVVISEIPDILSRCVSRDEAAIAMAQRVFKSLYENTSNGAYVNWLLVVLVSIRDACKLVVKQLTSWVIYSDEEKRFNVEIIAGLILSELLNLGEYNVHLAKVMDGGRNKTATDFAASLVQTLLSQEFGTSISELHSVVDAMIKVANRPGTPESLRQVVELARSCMANSSHISLSKDDKAKQSRDKKVLPFRTSIHKEESSITDNIEAEIPGFQDQVAVLFSEWCQLCDQSVTNELSYAHYVSQLQQSGLLKGDEIMERFFRILMELSVAHSLTTDPVLVPGTLSHQPTQYSQQISYFPIDSYAKLVVTVLKYFSANQVSGKVALLPKILTVIGKAIQKDADEKKHAFNPRPYVRLFINWFLDLVSPDHLDVTNFQVLSSFANIFHVLQPLRVPGFSFAWLELVSNRNFMPKLLMWNSPKGWPLLQRLLVDLFKFMEPYLRNADLQEPVQYLYKGTLRVLLVLLHDFPEFLCEYHFSFCDVIPSTCVQMRNVILSAFPRNMRLPDPSTPNLKIDLLAEIAQSPHILSEVDAALKAKQIKSDIDEYIKGKPDGASFLTDLNQKLLLPQNEAQIAGARYNVPLINSLVLYVGMQAIQQLQTKSASQQSSTQQTSMDIFLVSTAIDIYHSLLKNLDTEGRYLFLNAVANQLRYPNNHTHYFSFVLIYLFAEANQESIQEQITRVLLERLIVNRPHPWGLLITFIELIKNPRYDFWERSFVQNAPQDIKALLESVSRSCGGPANVFHDSIDSALLPSSSH